MNSAYYEANLHEFRSANLNEVLGMLDRAHHFSLEPQQRVAWEQQIKLLQSNLNGIPDGRIFFEFAIPRMGKRADVVLITGGIVFVIEFKVGASNFEGYAIEQVHDYALDLKNFHRGSHEASILPVLIATKAVPQNSGQIEWAEDHVAEPVLSSGSDLPALIHRAVSLAPKRLPLGSDWAASGYLPTPTIIEAAQALYKNHNVDEISRSDAGAKNLNATTGCIQEIVENAERRREKVICFVTGVPGSGKTLAGLNLATQTSDRREDEQAVFLSGNGPLVAVLREALARDQVAQTGERKKDALRRVSSFVQNIHHFRDDCLRDLKPPANKIVIFDEAQRAWNKEQASKFMQTKKGVSDFDESEPSFLIGAMDRHQDWCAIICLVGGGQEINTGEAGLSEWMVALQERYTNWKVFLSDRLSEDHYGLQTQTTADGLRERVNWQDDLHLNVCMRSFRAEKLSEFIGYVLSNQPARARGCFQAIQADYPIALTRDLARARHWLRQRARGTERFGLIASSGAQRLRPEGIHVKSKIDPTYWFLNDARDVRSAYYLEEVASEFDVQGLEVDWAGVCWDGDLRYSDGGWSFNRFSGTRWQNVAAPERQKYLLNAYRVILTRARQGMVLFVPQGDPADQTRRPSYYDKTAEYLSLCGIPTALE